MSIKIYKCDSYDGMVEDSDGDWVRLSDVFTPEVITFIRGATE